MNYYYCICGRHDKMKRSSVVNLLLVNKTFESWRDLQHFGVGPRFKDKKQLFDETSFNYYIICSAHRSHPRPLGWADEQVLVQDVVMHDGIDCTLGWANEQVLVQDVVMHDGTDCVLLIGEMRKLTIRTQTIYY